MPKLTKKERDLYKPLDESAATIERGRKAAVRVGSEAEKKLSMLDRFLLGGGVAKVIKDTGYKYSKAFINKFKSIFEDLNNRSDPISEKLSEGIKEEAIRTHGIHARKFKTGVDYENLKDINLSPRIHKTNTALRDIYFKRLKQGMQEGNGAVKLAERLLDLESLQKVRIPKYIKDIENTLRRAARANDSVRRGEQIREVQRLLRKHKDYIDNLTRAGADGFQQLGIRRASRQFAKQAESFIKDISKLNESNIDRIVETWSTKKAKYYHQRVVRTETIKTTSEYNRDIWSKTDGVIGLAIILSESHPKYDICDELAGFYPNIDTAPRLPHHPNCICREQEIYADDKLEELGLPSDTLEKIESINQDRRAKI